MGGKTAATGLASIWAPRNLVAAALWFIVIVPPAFAFWLVAGDLVGVPPEQFRTLLAASILGVGIATLVQVVAGYRLPVFEGPAGNYLDAIAVVAVSNPDPAQATGGLLAAGLSVFALGAFGANRLLGRLFTRPVVQTDWPMLSYERLVEELPLLELPLPARETCVKGNAERITEPVWA